MAAGQPTILIIEDHIETLELLARVVRSFGYNVLIASRALDGLDIARQQKPDLILTDVNLPDMTGFDLAATLRSDQHFAQVPIVAASVEDAGGDKRSMSAAAGINGFITKPVNIDTLEVELQFYLSGGSETPDNPDDIHEARAKLLHETVARLEERVRDLEVHAAEMEQLDAMKDTFIQLTGHELRTPLTLITGYAGLLEDHPELKNLPGAASLIDGLSESVERMGTIIEEILATSRILSRKLEIDLTTVNPATLVAGVLHSYASAFEERRLRVHFNPQEWPQAMAGDAAMLRLMFSSLISNAIKYTPDGGKIIVRAQYNDNLVRFSVADTGIGIDPQEQERIFMPMRYSGDITKHGTSKTAFMGGGLGLGLAICRGVVEAHGGRIKVESKGRNIQKPPGSEFIVLLPLRSDKSSREITQPIVRRLTRTPGKNQ